MNALAIAFGRFGGRMGRGFGQGGPGWAPGAPGPGQGFRAPGLGRGFGTMAFGHGHGLFGPILGFFMLLVWLGVIAVIVVAFWQIFKKSGHPGALGLLMLVPIVNLGALLYLAFSEWPALTKPQEHPAATPPSPGYAGSAMPVADTQPLPVQPAEPAPAPATTEPPSEQAPGSAEEPPADPPA